MLNRFWTAMRALAPLTATVAGFSFSEIPDWLASTEVRALMAQLVAQLAIGVTDAIINIAIGAAFGVV